MRASQVSVDLLSCISSIIFPGTSKEARCGCGSPLAVANGEVPKVTPSWLVLIGARNIFCSRRLKMEPRGLLPVHVATPHVRSEHWVPTGNTAKEGSNPVDMVHAYLSLWFILYKPFAYVRLLGFMENLCMRQLLIWNITKSKKDIFSCWTSTPLDTCHTSGLTSAQILLINCNWPAY